MSYKRYKSPLTSLRRERVEDVSGFRGSRIKSEGALGFGAGRIDVFRFELSCRQRRMGLGRLRAPEGNIQGVDRVVHTAGPEMNATDEQVRFRLIWRQEQGAAELVQRSRSFSCSYRRRARSR